MPSVNAKSKGPIRKVAAGGLAAAIVTVGVFIVQSVFHTTVDSELATALVTLISFGVAYLVPSAASD